MEEIMKKNIMKKNILKPLIAIFVASALLAGCKSADEMTPGDGVNGSFLSESSATDETGDAKGEAGDANDPAGDTAESNSADASENTDKDAAVTEPAPYFLKGVYMYYPVADEDPSMDRFYIFRTGEEGYTENGSDGTGAPFSCKQADGKVEFTFGGEGEETEVFTVQSLENRAVTGAFEDGVKLVFLPVDDEDPDTFDAVNYINAQSGKDLVYTDANGWRVRYDPDLFEVSKDGTSVNFVYTGESAGTNMITAYYTVENDAKTTIDNLAKEWGENATTTEGIFPGTEDAPGYWAVLPPAEEGSGIHMTAIARDYMDGALVFEMTGHVCGDDEIDIPVSDALAGVIDSLEFITGE